MGVEITDMRSKAKAARSKIVNGVAGLNILNIERTPSRKPAGRRRRYDAALQ
jgi:hypothetical protein